MPTLCALTRILSHPSCCESSVPPSAALDIFGPPGLRAYVRESLIQARVVEHVNIRIHELHPHGEAVPPGWEEFPPSQRGHPTKGEVRNGPEPVTYKRGG